MTFNISRYKSCSAVFVELQGWKIALVQASAKSSWASANCTFFPYSSESHLPKWQVLSQLSFQPWNCNHALLLEGASDMSKFILILVSPAFHRIWQTGDGRK